MKSNGPDFNIQISTFRDALNTRLNVGGEAAAASAYEAIQPLLEWMDYIRGSELTGCADELIDGLRATLVETVGFLTLAFVRPAIFGMRAQIDIILSWIYFKDHPVEWSRVCVTGDGFKLKREVSEYMDENFPMYKKKFDLMAANTGRELKDPYKLLSAFVHSQSPSALPKYGDLATIIWSQDKVADAIRLQGEVSSYIGDILMVAFSLKWNSLPVQVQKRYASFDATILKKILTSE